MGENQHFSSPLNQRGTRERNTHSLADLASFQSVDEKNIAEAGRETAFRTGESDFGEEETE